MSTMTWTLAVVAVRVERRCSAGATRGPRSRRRTTYPRRLDMAPPADPSNALTLPDRLRPLERLARNLLWTWDEEIAGVLAEVDPGGLARASRQPGRDARGGSARPARAARGRRRLPRPPDPCRGPARRAPRKRGLVPDPVRRARGDRLLLPRVRAQRGAAAVLGRARDPRRRPPQGGQRPRRADRRRRPLLPQRLLPPGAHAERRAGGAVRRPRPRAAAAHAGARRRRRPARRSRSRSRAPRCTRASGASTSAAFRCSCSTPTCRTTRPPSAPSPTASTAATASTACARRSCSAWAACRRFAPAATSRTSST